MEFTELQDLDSIEKLIRKAQTIGILTHKEPDGDTIGSALAIWHSLSQMCDKKIVVLCSDEIPSSFDFLPGVSVFRRDISQAELLQINLLIAVDVASVRQLGSLSGLTETITNVNIDHHSENTMFGTYNLVLSEYASAAEIVYLLIDKLKLPINTDVATCLIAGILYDTVGFTKSNTTAKTLEISSELVLCGGKLNFVMHKLFHSRTIKQVRFQADVLNRLETELNGDIVWSTVPQYLLNGITNGTSEGRMLAATMQDLEGVKLAILFMERQKSLIKVSFRANGNIDASSFARQFGGGGHEFAASCDIKGRTLDEAVENVLTLVKQFVQSN